MTLHFAYGSNMSRKLMQGRCPDAQALGIARLPGWSFVINREGFGSIAPTRGGEVLGVVWQLSTRDVVAINAYESISTGLYVRRKIAVRLDGKQAKTPNKTLHKSLTTTLVYVTRQGGKGRPRPSYIHLVVQAAREWGLPEHYIETLARWSPSGWRGVRLPDTGEVG